MFSIPATFVATRPSRQGLLSRTDVRRPWMAPYAPVYRLLSSWKRTASALVARRFGPSVLSTCVTSSLYEMPLSSAMPRRHRRKSS